MAFQSYSTWSGIMLSVNYIFALRKLVNKIIEIEKIE